MPQSSGWALAGRWFGLVLISTLALQVFFVARIALMRWVDPESTAFQRSEFWRVVVVERRAAWRQSWRPYAQISVHLKRAVIASEDAAFSDHGGFEWDAIEKAWGRNQRAQDRAERLNQIAEERATRSARNASGATGPEKWSEHRSGNWPGNDWAHRRAPCGRRLDDQPAVGKESLSLR